MLGHSFAPSVAGKQIQQYAETLTKQHPSRHSFVSSNSRPIIARPTRSSTLIDKNKLYHRQTNHFFHREEFTPEQQIQDGLRKTFSVSHSHSAGDQ